MGIDRKKIWEELYSRSSDTEFLEILKKFETNEHRTQAMYSKELLVQLFANLALALINSKKNWHFMDAMIIATDILGICEEVGAHFLSPDFIANNPKESPN